MLTHLLLTLTVHAAGPAAEEPSHEPVAGPEEAHPAPHHDAHPRHITGLKLAEINVLGHGEEGVQVGVGVGPFFEETLVPGWLDVELAVLVAHTRGVIAIPIELVAKKPFHVSRSVTAYVGAGPALDIIWEGEKPAVARLAAMGAVGAYVWVSPHVGVDMEVNLVHLFEAHGVDEIILAAGPVVQF